ncbi:MAG: hypothetical protein MUP41_10095, partial [Desulfobacterales bacterium]|nr:hypothetical protein [Desulfobacterales bacterium]
MGKQPYRRGRSRRWMGYFFSFFLGALLTFGGYTYLKRDKPLSPEDFSQKVFLVDQIVQSQLYEIGVQKKNVLLHQSSLKREGEMVWKQSSLKVRVPSPRSFSSIEGNFRRSLSALGKTVSIQSSQKSESLRLEVKV